MNAVIGVNKTRESGLLHINRRIKDFASDLGDTVCVHTQSSGLQVKQKQEGESLAVSVKCFQFPLT